MGSLRLNAGLPPVGNRTLPRRPTRLYHVSLAGRHGRSQQRHMIRVVHLLSRVLEAGRHAVDGELDEAEDAAALRVVRLKASKARKQSDLEFGQ